MSTTRRSVLDERRVAGSKDDGDSVGAEPRAQRPDSHHLGVRKEHVQLVEDDDGRSDDQLRQEHQNTTVRITENGEVVGNFNFPLV